MKHHHNKLRSFQVNETIIEKEEPEDDEEETVATLSSNVNQPYLKRTTPILFSTNRGLHLRITSHSPIEIQNLASTTNSKANRTTSSVINSNYNISFCDLERWSQNRANTISLEDTFTIPKPAVVPSSTASGSLASTSLRMFQQRSTSVRFNGYARFDIE